MVEKGRGLGQEGQIVKFTRGMYHRAGNWIIFMPLVGDVHELVEYVPDDIIARLWVKMRNRKLQEVRDYAR